MTPKNIYKRLALLPIVSLFLLVGCVNDDLSVCGLKLHFKYTRNMANTDRFKEEITKVNLYIFDSVEGTLVDEYTVEQNPMPEDFTIYLNLEPGLYDFVAWGDLKNSYSLTFPAVKGVTTRTELEVQLNRSDSAITNLPTNLYYGSIEQYQVASHDLLIQKDTVISMIKDTKEITVVAHGLAIIGSNRTAGTAYDCHISALDGNLSFKNYTISDDLIQYIPNADVEEDSILVSRFAIVRNHDIIRDDEGRPRSPQSRVRVNRIDSDGTSQRSLLDMDLYPILVAAANMDPLVVAGGGDLPVDIKDKYQIDIFFDETYGTASIFIGDWEYRWTDQPVGGDYNWK